MQNSTYLPFSALVTVLTLTFSAPSLQAMSPPAEDSFPSPSVAREKVARQLFEKFDPTVAGLAMNEIRDNILEKIHGKLISLLGDSYQPSTIDREGLVRLVVSNQMRILERQMRTRGWYSSRNLYADNESTLVTIFQSAFLQDIPASALSTR